MSELKRVEARIKDITKYDQSLIFSWFHSKLLNNFTCSICMHEGLDHILNDASLHSGLITALADQLIQTDEVKLPGFNIDKHTLAESLLAWDKLPWLGDEMILKLAMIAGYCKDNDSKIYHFLQAICNSARVLFINHSRCYAELKSFAETLVGQSSVFSLANITPAQRAELVFAYVTTLELCKEIPQNMTDKLLLSRWVLLRMHA